MGAPHDQRVNDMTPEDIEKLATFFYDHANATYLENEEEDEDATAEKESIEGSVSAAYGPEVLADMRTHSKHLLDLEYALDNSDDAKQARLIREKHQIPNDKFVDFG